MNYLFEEDWEKIEKDNEYYYLLRLDSKDKEDNENDGREKENTEIKRS